MTADDADLEEGGISVLRGNVEITRDRQQVSAETITFDQAENDADLEGNVEYWDDAIYLSGESAHIEFNQENGEFENAYYMIKDNRGRGNADKLFHQYGKQTKLENVDYTTCDPEDNFWRFSAEKIDLNHEENWGSARNVFLHIKDIPVLYTPYISFPLSKERKTGFLIPSFGNTNRNGVEVLTPFYWNIAPDKDATITPRLMSDSGLMLMGQFRYLLDRGEGELNAEFLPSDSQFEDEDRSFLSFTHRQDFLDTGRVFMTYNRVSDKQYFEDFGNNIGVTSTRYLERRADAFYSGNWWNLRGRVQDYQTVDNTIPVNLRPYKRLPQVIFNAYPITGNRRINLRLESEFTYFDRGDNDIFFNDTNGARVDLYPSVSYPIHTPYSFFIPKAGVRYTQYSLNDEGGFKPSPSRTLPIVSLDSGLFFERQGRLFNREYIHTLEPRLYYLYIPHDDQTDLPIFDTGLYNFSFDSLFRENRFSGPDRLGDANQVTVAITSRFIDGRTGREAGYVSLGQIYYLRDREVHLPTLQEREEASSPLVAEVGLSLEHWRFRNTLQWDPNNDRTEQLVTALQYNPGPDKVINIGYRKRRTSNSISAGFARTDIEQTEMSFVWPLTNKWRVVGNWDYSLPEERTVDAFAGLEYESCCWGFRAVARRFITDSSGDYNTGVFLQLELKGLAGIGEKTVEFLEENISGYKRGF